MTGFSGGQSVGTSRHCAAFHSGCYFDLTTGVFGLVLHLFLPCFFGKRDDSKVKYHAGFTTTAISVSVGN